MASARAASSSHCTTSSAQTGRPDWFGLDLLKIEQSAYQALVQSGVKDADLLDGLLRPHL